MLSFSVYSRGLYIPLDGILECLELHKIHTQTLTHTKTARDNKVTDFFMSVHDVLKQKCGENQPHCFSMASTREKGMCVAQISRNV